MPFTITMPKLSPTMEEGTIVKWIAKEGDFIKSGQVLMEVATDKATVEHTALDDGYLRKILVKEGDEAIVNQAIAIFTEEKNESIEGYQPEGEKKKEEKKEPQKNEKEEEKVSKEKEPQKKEMKGLEETAFVPEKPLENYEFPFPEERMVSDRVFASPLAKKIAQEKNLDLTSVKGSGPRGRIVSKDLENAKSLPSFMVSRKEAPKKTPGSYEEEKLSPIRKIVARRLREAKTFIPHFYVQQIVDAERLVKIREELRSIGIKVTYNDFVVRAASLALKKHPEINSGFNSVNQTIVRFQTIDISVAVDTPSGLITPIIRHADYKKVTEISLEIRSLAKKAKEGKLQEQEYKGGSFTVSNLGMYGITDFQAIINPPQAAIIAVGGILDQPVVKERKVIPGKTMNMTLSVDHRVVDGVHAAEFIRTMKHYIENPLELVL